MAHQITPQLMFQSGAEEAMRLYISLFKNSEIKHIERYGPEAHRLEGAVKKAVLSLNGLELICIDSPVEHAFGFTPSISLFVDCESESELNEAFAKLSDEGAVLMPLDNYGFSFKFAWVNDRFGVSWQLNLA